MDSFGRMGLASHQTIIDARRAELRQHAAEDRLSKATSHDASPAEDQPSRLRRLIAGFSVHGQRARTATRDVLRTPAAGAAPLRTVNHQGR